MKKLLIALLFALPAFGQNVPYSDITLSSSGRPVGGAPIAVCSNPGLTTTSAQVISNIAVLTMSSNPITAGFVANQAIAVSGFTGADTYFNGGTVTSTGISNNFLILSVTSTQITYALTHANASATSNGSVFQAGSQAQACAPLSSIFNDSAGASPITQPGLTSSGLGNYQFYATGGSSYYVQFYGATIGEILKPVVLPCGGNAACALTGAITINSPGSLTVNGTGTLPTLNGVLTICNAVYACTDAGLQLAVTALTAGGRIVVASGNGVTISNTVNISNPNIDFSCGGPGASIQIALAGDVFNVTNSRFRFHDCEIGLPTTTRTGAIIHASSSGAVLGSAYNLDIIGNVSSTNNGHFFLMDTANANQWDFDRIYMPRGTTWTTAFKFVNSSASATASTYAIKEFRGGASFTDAGFVADGAIDTVQIIQSTWNNDSGSGKAAHIRNTVAGFINPRFIFFNQVSLEATDTGAHTSTCLQIDAGRNVRYNDGYCANTTTGFIIGASALDTDISHNLASSIQQSFATIASGATQTVFAHNQIRDVSQQTDNGFNLFSIAANATDITLDHNTFSCSGGNRPPFGISVAAGTGDRFKFINNNFGPASGPCFFAGAITNAATGFDMQIYGNGPLANVSPRMAFGGNPAQTASAIDMASAFPLCWRNNANGADVCGSKDTSDNWTWPTISKSKSFVADQGAVCTNGELALSAGWQSTGSATVTGVAGNGQTCSWTITTGTTTAANPTVTDTLTNALPAATTRCWMFLEYGPASTHTAAAGEGFAQTTLSATAPVFTFNGTPTAAGKTYLVVRTCGP